MRRAALSARAYMLLSNGAIICLLAGGLLVLGRTAPDAAGETAGFALLAAGFVGLFLHWLRLARFYTRVIAGLQNAGALLAGTAHELREASKSSAATSSEQAAAVAETAATIEELAATARAIADGAGAVGAAAAQTVETMSDTRAAVEAIAERSLRLGEQSQRIGDILGLINEIAEQTNLLALNAAIEAARAGEAGKGFAVVAGEVRKLAKRSLESTESIRVIVESIQAETNTAILGTEQGARQANAVAALIEQAVPRLEESVAATRQQQAAADQVATAIAQVQQAAAALASDQERLTATTMRVETLVAELRQLERRLGAIEGTSKAGVVRRAGSFWFRDVRESGTCVALVAAAAGVLVWGGASHETQAATWAGLALGAAGLLLLAGLRFFRARWLFELSGTLRSGVTEIASAVNELRSAVGASGSAAVQQSAAVAEMSATIEQLAAMATAISDGTSAAASAAEETLGTMADAERTIEEIAERSRELGRQSSRIGEILALMNEISEQTNMLALNAAIEAARAGDAGKGFAVVAGEVRKLAERSLESTESIRRIVDAIQAETNETIAAAERGTESAREVGDLMRQTAPMLEESLSATRQQQLAAAQVAAAIAQIHSAADALAAEQAQHAPTAERLDQLVRELESALKVYRVSSSDRAAGHGTAAATAVVATA